MSLRSIKSNLDLSTRRRPSPPHQRPEPARLTRQREKIPIKPGFVLKFGIRHHAFPQVPWPLSCEQDVLDLDALYHQFLKDEYGLSFVDFSESPPGRVLDIGTGLGSWVVDAASQWKSAEFIGMDIVPIQPTLETTMEPDVTARIKWVNGDFLERLPFGDDSFDYVRCVNVARAIPEDKWLSLCQEIHRVLSPSGALEVIVHNIVFPYIPQIVTQTRLPETPTSPVAKEFRGLQRHKHSLLEKLFFGVFERRFINVRPTSIVANYMNIHFKRVTETPIYFHSFDADNPAGRPRLPVRFLAWQSVHGCKETMWEEALLRTKETGVDLFHEVPPTEEEEGFTTRQRFDLLFDQYEREMHSHTGIAAALERFLGWKQPGREATTDGLYGFEEDLETLSKGHIALSQSSFDDLDMSRQISCFVGFKDGA